MILFEHEGKKHFVHENEDLRDSLNSAVKQKNLRVDMIGLDPNKKLIEVLIYHNNFILGLRNVFRHCATGSIRMGHYHDCCVGVLEYTGGRAQRSTLSLREGEYIIDVLMCQRNRADTIMFFTSQGRSVSFGGERGENSVKDDEHFRLCIKQRTKLVGFCSRQHATLKSLGLIKEAHANWYSLKHFILMRRLLQEERAETCEESDDFYISLFTDAPEDLFRTVLSFLAPNQTNGDTRMVFKLA